MKDLNSYRKNSKCVRGGHRGVPDRGCTNYAPNTGVAEQVTPSQRELIKVLGVDRPAGMMGSRPAGRPTRKMKIGKTGLAQRGSICAGDSVGWDPLDPKNDEVPRLLFDASQDGEHDSEHDDAALVVSACVQHVNVGE